jgi:hypothetical protein
VGIADDVERFRSRSLCCGAAMLNQCTANAALPRLRLHEKRVQLGIAVLSRKNGRETHDCFGYFCHENSTTFDLSDGQPNRIAICKERLTIAWILK